MNTDHDFYKYIFGGTYEKDVIEPCLKTADIQIGCMVIKEDLDELEEYSCKYAACIQAEYIAAKIGNPAGNSTSTGTSGLDSFSSLKLGDFSISTDSKNTDADTDTDTDDDSSGGKGELCGRAAAYLEKYGLLYRGGIVL